MNAPSVDIYKTRFAKLATESKTFDSVVYRSSIRETFPDFDLDESDKQASCKYWEMHERVTKQVKDLKDKFGKVDLEEDSDDKDLPIPKSAS